MARTNPGRIQAQERKRQAIELRRAGFGYDRIAQECGYASASGAWHAVERALRDMIREPADELRALELVRLDRMQVGLWEAASGGKVEAVDRVLKIMERRSKLLGLDAPTKLETDVTTKGKAVGPSLQSLLSQMTSDELDAIEPILSRVAGEHAAGEPQAPEGGEGPA